MKVVVTGSSGYIGGQIALQLKDAGHEVHGLDRNLPPAHLRGVPYRFMYQDYGGDLGLSWLLRVQPDAIIHCAATSLVGPSMIDPAEYYNNNVTKTVRMLDVIRQELPNTRLIFSSSASVYGQPNYPVCQETDVCNPISPYGESKRMIEQILASYHRAYNLDYVSFRYFNACGADPEARHGQAPNATHIIARVLESIRDNKEFTLYGTDYDTRDGSCIRDYVHVGDIAQAHIQALSKTIKPGVYNLGSNEGISNKEIIAAAERITGKKVNVVNGMPRVGDPAKLIASSAKFSLLAGNWRKYNLDDMIQHAWKWYVRKNQKV